MKKLIFGGEGYEAERIVKTDDAIVGYIGNTEVFALRGVDFSKVTYEIRDESDNIVEPEIPEPSIEQLALAVTDLQLQTQRGLLTITNTKGACLMSFNHFIWKYLFKRGLRTAEDVEMAFQKGILTQAERDDILR